ncbi:AAA family ATPase [Hymenobacter cellulosilyticus]|uniref:AAA family ATPase n=1 Tax=Hymenobacter cellulosilyticus TaxID=2932248 RepID=A0A8T9PYX8_9BACT|nr:AAA family ATPase [Hymenobacter cellulosilyticus]UOQ70444.1 AAA family ATPase [Hymenobacter cellulosilyticus]
MENKLAESGLLVEKLNLVTRHLKATFVGKDDIIDLMSLCLVGRENLFLLGPPGTAKSALVRALAQRLEGKTFEYLLTRFTEPNELFGPFDIRKLREGDLVTNTEGMLPEANLIFLDELLNANSAILNSLLMVLNERVFRRGRETRALPALLMVAASNHLPEDEALQALFDRFLVRVHCDYVAPESLADVLEAGWNLERRGGAEAPRLRPPTCCSCRPPYPALICSRCGPSTWS